MGKIKLNKLKRDIGDSGIVLYGAGNFAHAFYQQVKIYELNIKAVVVSYTSKEKFFFGIPLYSIDFYRKYMDDADIFLIAVGDLYLEEIAEILNNLGRKYFFAKDYIRNSYVCPEIPDQCISDIIDWCVDELKGTEKNIRKYIARELEIQKNLSKIFPAKILFIISDFSPRVVKITQSLCKLGYIVDIFFFPNSYMREVCRNEMQLLQISFHYTSCMEELMYEIILSKSVVCHLFVDSTRSIDCSTLISNKILFPRMIYDEYDIINGLYVGYVPSHYKAERFCLENADAICNRGYEKDYLLNEMHFNIKGEWLQFSDYCRDDVDFPCLYKNDDEELSICYVGLVDPSAYEPSCYCQAFFHLGTICEKNHCHIHIYPSYWDENKYSKFIEMDNQLKYFHIHRPVDYNLLIQSISCHDYGIIPMRKGFEKLYHHGRVNRNQFIYSTTNKLFDYLDAGLPIIAAYPKIAIRILAKENVVLPWTNEEIDFQFLQKHRNKMKQNAVNAREKFRIKNHIHDLISFYQSVSKI